MKHGKTPLLGTKMNKLLLLILLTLFTAVNAQTVFHIESGQTGGTVKDGINANTDELWPSLRQQGTWNADTNNPDITTTTNPGHFWVVSDIGVTDLGGITDWQVGDWAVKSGGGWLKIDILDQVDNTSDSSKPISLAVQSALNNKLETHDLAPTGVITPDTNAIATLNTDPTKFDLPAVHYMIAGDIYDYAGATAIDPQYQVGSNVVLVGLDVNGLVLIDEIAYGQSEWKDDDLLTIVPITRLQAAAGNTGPNSTISQLRHEHYPLSNWFVKDRIYRQFAVSASYDLAPNSGAIVRSSNVGQINQLSGRFFDLQRKPIDLSAVEDLIAVQFTGVPSPLVTIAAPFIAKDKYSTDFGVSLTANTISFVAPDTILDSNSGFLTEGFKEGDILAISGSGLNNSTTFEISTVTANTITVPSGITEESSGQDITITTYMRNLDQENYACHFVMRPTGITSNYFIKLSSAQYPTRDEALSVRFNYGAFTTAQVIPVARLIMQSGFDEIDTILDERPRISRRKPHTTSQGVTNIAGFANGSFLEKPKLWVVTDGITVEAKLNNQSGANSLNVQFNGLNYKIDVTIPAEIELTQGTDEEPTENYIYYLLQNSIPTLTKSTTGFPVNSNHAKIGVISVSTASFVQQYGTLKTWAHTDHIRQHLQHINERSRLEDAKYQNGIDSSVTIVTQATLDDVYLSNTTGEAAQLHLYHPYPAFDMQTGDVVFIANNFTTKFLPTANLNTQLTDANNDSLRTTRFNLVKWASISEDANNTTDSKIFINLPRGSYNNDDDAINDINNTSVMTIPQRFRGVGILLERLTFRHTVVGPNETWVLLNTEDLRGRGF